MPVTTRCNAYSLRRSWVFRKNAHDQCPIDAQIIELDLERPPAFTDEALALRFALRHSDDLRYVAAWGRWLHWDGARWQFDDTMMAFDHARKICRTAARNARPANATSDKRWKS
jgi:phage/plasmid-associated DNA primase